MGSKSRDITRESLGIIEYDDVQRLIKTVVSSAKITLGYKKIIFERKDLEIEIARKEKTKRKEKTV